nr:hypothetical protein [Tanacetum cinerariifolium]
MLEDESRSKMLQKEKDPMMSEKNVNTKPVDYAGLNKFSQDFETCFVSQTELSAEQVFWCWYSVHSKEPNLSSSTTIVEVPKELPKVSMVNSSLKKLKFHLASFDMFLIDEMTEVQNVFNQMKQAVEQHCVEKNKFQDKMNDVLKENERLLAQAISVDIVNIVVHDNVNYACKTVNDCARCGTIETELQKEFIKKECYDNPQRENDPGRLVATPELLSSVINNSSPLDVSKDQCEDFSDSNDEFSSTDDNSFSIDNIEYVEASSPNSELVSSEVMEIVISKVGDIDDDILLTIKDDILREKLLNINLLIATIEALNDNPTPFFDFMTKSSSTSLNSFLEETNTFDNSLLEFETFCFDLEEISSGSTTTRSDISLPEYEAFYEDHVKEISSGSTTTHSDSSLYDSFIFDLSINTFPPADRSDFYEFADELIHIISLPEYDYFFFKIEPNSGDFTMDVVEDISPIREPRVHNALPTHLTLQLNLEFKLSSESLFTYVVWNFLPFLLYSVAPQYLLSFGNEDTIFDPGICNYHFFF